MLLVGSSREVVSQADAPAPSKKPQHQERLTDEEGPASPHGVEGIDLQERLCLELGRGEPRTTPRTGEELRRRDEVTGRDQEHRGVGDASRGGEARDDLARRCAQHPQPPGDDDIQDGDEGEAGDPDSEATLGFRDVARGSRGVAVDDETADDDDVRVGRQDGQDEQGGSRDECRSA